jgi:hypothetical protein
MGHGKMPKHMIILSVIVITGMLLLFGNDWACEIKKMESKTVYVISDKKEYTSLQNIDTTLSKQMIADYNNKVPKEQLYEKYKKMTREQINLLIESYESR